MLACGSSDGAISLLTYTGDGPWDVKKISNAHTVRTKHVCFMFPLPIVLHGPVCFNNGTFGKHHPERQKGYLLYWAALGSYKVAVGGINKYILEIH